MLTLTPNEARVLGVLVEKAQTTPQQYPLTLNALVNGCNQKNNREPVTSLSEERVFEALEGLRNKGLVREVMLSGSRVQKYRHIARETLDIDTNQLIILTELLLRGPQTMGELRGHASRMHPLESTEIVRNILESLTKREPALVRELPPAPGDRSPRFVQLLCPNLHPLDAPARPSAYVEASVGPALPRESHPQHDTDTRARLERLEAEVAQLREMINHIAQSLGESIQT